jgi:hypothetical protein
MVAAAILEGILMEDYIVYFNTSFAGVAPSNSESERSGRPFRWGREPRREDPACDTIVVSNPRVAAIFKRLRLRQILLVLIQRECSLSDLAEATQVSLNLLHHHIGRLISFGLVKISGYRRRAGAPVKLYRATARTFFVPADLAGAPTEPLNERLRDVLERSLAGAYKGVVFACDGTNAQMRLVRDQEFNARVSELWAELDLSEAEAGVLSRELGAILGRYAGRRGKGRRRYMIHSAVVPW